MDPTASPDAKALAAAIDGHHREAAYDQVIVGYLLQLADELKTGEGGEAEKVRRRVSSLVNELGDGTLARLVEMGGNEAQRRQFLLDANQGLAVDAVVKVLRAAAEGGGQSISTSMTRLLSKLAVHADKGGAHMRARADTALRENVEELIAGWKLADPNPDQYTAVLDAMAKSSPLFQIRVERDDGQITGPMRVLQLALEVDAWGPTVQTAVGDLVGMGMASSLIQMIDQAPPGTKVADEVRNYLTSPSQLKNVLDAADVDEGTLQMLIERMGSAAIPPLLDVLADSDSRSVRRKVFDRLVKMGPEVGERAVERLADGRWFVIRNMLALMQRLETLPAHFDPARLLEHPDERVRRESLPLALKKGVAGRERVIAAALGETDERTVRMALLELQKDIPETLVPVLVNRVVKSERSPEIRALGARALGNSRSNLALEVLLGLSIEGKSLMGRSKLAEKSPLLIAAIQTLAKAWPADPRSREVLALASKSKDVDVRKAAEPALGVP